ncbi:MAG: hypothetical protein KGJ13_07385 [Patescibacteria group bacterium]|nr:hypothetical protein [Patescibacteria group bacterium]
MANLIKYNVDTAFTEDTTFETNLNSLASAGTAVGSVISNGTNLALLADLSIQLASFTAGAPDYVEIHVVPLLGDGTTYADFFSAGPTFVGNVPVTNGASAKAFCLTNIVILPGSFKFGLVNQAGASFAASGQKVFYRLYDYNNNG